MHVNVLGMANASLLVRAWVSAVGGWIDEWIQQGLTGIGRCSGSSGGSGGDSSDICGVVI